MVKKYLLLFVLCFALLFINSSMVYCEQLKEAPLVYMKSSTNGVVRVHLKSLGSINQLSLNINGKYKINNNYYNNEIIDVYINDSNSISLKTKSGLVKSYNEIYLVRESISNNNYLKISKSRYNQNYYPADLKITIDKKDNGNAQLKVVAYIFIEDYLYGVVPYEIGDSENIEALKAQAIAARTYTKNKMNVRKYNFYDVSDTISDQVYYGTNEKYKNCKYAIDSTAGIVLTNNGKLTDTLYTASNGGQTESAYNVWKSVGYDYLKVKDDPFDIQNPNSKVKTATISKNLENNSSIYNLIYNKTINKLNQKTIYPTSLNISRINSISLSDPKYKHPSRLYTKANFDIAINYSNGYGYFNDNVSVEVDIFKELEQLLNLRISTLDNELWYVSEVGDNIIIKARRYGHGIGMSQHGAMQMGKLGYNYAHILAFYYENCTRVQYVFNNNILTFNSIELNNQNNTNIDNYNYAYVNTISGSLNLRALPNKSSEILYRIPKGEKVTILNLGNEWSSISYNSIDGYVMSSFLLAEQTNTTNNQALVNNNSYALVNTNYKGLNMRANSNYYSSVITVIPQSSKVEILEKLSGWAKVKFNNVIGYVDIKFLLFESNTNQNNDINDVYFEAIALSKGNDIPLYSSDNTNSNIVLYLKNNTSILASKYSDNWCKVKYGNTIAFAEKYNIITKNIPTATPNMPQNTNKPYFDPSMNAVENGSGTIYSKYDTNFVDVYNQCIEKDDYIAETIANNIPVEITKVGKIWSEIKYNNKIYYCLNDNIVFD